MGVFFFSPVFLLNYTYPFTPFRQRPRLWLAVKKKKQYGLGKNGKRVVLGCIYYYLRKKAARCGRLHSELGLGRSRSLGSRSGSSRLLPAETGMG